MKFQNPLFYNTMEEYIDEPVIKFSNIKYYYMLSFLSIVIFFPTGLFSLLYIHKTYECYRYSEIKIGNKYFNKSYKLMQFSIIFGIILMTILLYIYL